MGFTQTLAATLALVILILITLSLNEGVYKETDLSKAVGQTCGVNAAGQLVAGSTLDARGLLYGPVSVRGATISALVLGVLSFLIAFLSKSLDFEMDSKYQEGSYMLYGNPRAYLAGIAFRLSAAGTALAMTVSSLLVLVPLSHNLGFLTVAADVNRTSPAACDDLGANELERFDLLSAILVLSATSVCAVGFMVHAVKYDAKASA
jgi:hypothetical protein